MKKTTYLLIACLVLLLAGGLYYFNKDEPLPQAPAQEVRSDPALNMVFTGNSLVEEKDGKRLWELSAESIELDQKTKQVYLKNLKGVIYQENGGKVEITARQATLDTKTRDIVLTGDIRATSSEGAILTAPSVRYAMSDRRFYGWGGVTLARGDTVVTGEKFESDGDFAKVRVQGNARVRKGVSAQ
ncbi:LPS export ABC transporter periplasmic protein LptC [Sporolituus thermophilus]|uniref:LPS export ABC transporter protein LptC n=1 Tax=Sporolituus thermophilus DSM 23256 TaxID=1123285 RepID=A0A1G7NEG5_9FIRM|nr:LPS export ABC transporter periplasmic protein LptC [Sporolituus thermophilus]SDF72423.1 LPS export ABC transporter protein LptC [Sporolituus thermophilus DSM 23256]